MKNYPLFQSILRLARRGTPWGALCAAFVALAPILAAQQPMLVPQPREVKAGGRPLVITPNLEIVLPVPVQPGDPFAAECLAREIKRASGLDIPVVSAATIPSDRPVIVLGRLDQDAIAQKLRARHVRISGIADQGTALSVRATGAVVGGKDAAGLFYGVQTLRQLVVGEGSATRILAAQVRDWPGLEYRGTQVDMSRGPVPKLSTLERIVRTAAQFKLNQLYMYMEDTFRLKDQPLVGVLSDSLTRADWKILVPYAARYHVTLVPATEDCGHLHKVMRFDEYSRFAERPHGAVIAVGDPRGAAFLNSMDSQLATVFPSPLYNVGCDETFELGLGRSKGMVEKEGYGPVYVDSLKTAAGIAEKYGKQAMFWGDIAVEHPEMIPSLPRNLIVASWEYGYHKTYDKWVQPFANTGMKIFVCPWVANTSVIIPDDEEAAWNIAGFLAAGRKVNDIGTIVTVWNDDGQTLYGLNWWGIVYGAASAWEPKQVSVAKFDQKFDWVFYRNPGHEFADAIASLSHLNEVLAAGNTNATLGKGGYDGAQDSMFFMNPFTPAGRAMVTKESPVASDVRMTAEHDYTVLANDRGLARRNAYTLNYYKFAALRLDDLGMRIEYAQEISNYYADAVAHQFDHGPKNPLYDDLSVIDGTNGRFQDLRDYTTRLEEIYKKLWLKENLPHWMPNMLQLYGRDSLLWQSLIARLAEARDEHYHGTPLPPPDAFGFLPATPVAPAQ